MTDFFEISQPIMVGVAFACTLAEFMRTTDWELDWFSRSIFVLMGLVVARSTLAAKAGGLSEEAQFAIAVSIAATVGILLFTFKDLLMTSLACLGFLAAADISTRPNVFVICAVVVLSLLIGVIAKFKKSMSIGVIAFVTSLFGSIMLVYGGVYLMDIWHDGYKTNEIVELTDDVTLMGGCLDTPGCIVRFLIVGFATIARTSFTLYRYSKSTLRAVHQGYAQVPSTQEEGTRPSPPEQATANITVRVVELPSSSSSTQTSSSASSSSSGAAQSTKAGPVAKEEPLQSRR
jgi:hypothetical protein